MATVLIIDDDKIMNHALNRTITRQGYKTFSAFTMKEGREKTQTNKIDVVLLDVRLPDGNGLEALPQIRSSPSKPEIIIITGFGDTEGAEKAIKSGAWDYIQKPCSTKEIALTLTRALEYRKAREEAEKPFLLKRGGIVGESIKLTEALQLVALAASGDLSVLLQGETGTGKELFARAIHANSARARNRFVIVDCASLPTSLAESILFGHERGAFTGAEKKNEGLVAQADGGTLFLDEIGELSLSLQKIFLRVLQEGHFRPVGSKQMQKSSFRLVAATNRDLEQMAKEGTFRQDLLFRIRGFSIEIPSLRDCKKDIPNLLHHYSQQISHTLQIEAKGFSSDFIQTLLAYDWPGNVREFIHALKEAFAKARNYPILYPKHLPDTIRVKLTQESLSKSDLSSDLSSLEPEETPWPPKAPLQETLSPFSPQNGEFPTLQQVRLSVEREYLQHLLERTQGNRKEACQLSNLSRTRLFELLKKHQLQ